MNRDLRLYLTDIVECIERIEEYTHGVTKQEFLDSRMLRDAVVHRVEIIGEAVRQIPEIERGHYPDVPWRRITDMRNRLIHGYFGVDISRVWDVVENDVVPLKADILDMLDRLGPVGD